MLNKTTNTFKLNFDFIGVAVDEEAVIEATIDSTIAL